MEIRTASQLQRATVLALVALFPALIACEPVRFADLAVTVRPFYDPRDPSVAALEAGLDRQGMYNAIFATGIFALLFGAAAWGCFRAARYWREREAP